MFVEFFWTTRWQGKRLDDMGKDEIIIIIIIIIICIFRK
jgi:hypothetical protein